MRNVPVFTLRFTLGLILLAGCSPPASTVSPAGGGITDNPAENSDTASAVIVDRLERRVEVTGPVERIVSLSPATTELLFALDLGDCVVGATEYCNYPEQALSIPRVGGGTLESLSSETIVSLKPDLVLCMWDTHQPLLETLERLEVPVCAVGAQSLDELYEQTRWIGRLTGRRSEADQLITAMSARHERQLGIVAAHRQDPPLRVFYEVWDEPLMTAAPNSFIGEMLSMAGLENILSDTSVRYPRISAETVVNGNPDLILAPTTHAENVDVTDFQKRPGWAPLKAVVNNRIYLISGDTVSRCGPRLLDALSEIIVAAYPDAAAQLHAEPPE